MEHKDHLQELMSDIIKVFGKQIVTEISFVNLLADYRAFDGNTDARKILIAIVSGRYAKQIVNLTTSQLDLCQLKYYAHELSKSDGFQENLVETIMRMIVYACNKDLQINSDYTILKKEEKYGCVGSNGDILIPFEYDKMLDFKSSFGIHIVCIKYFELGEVYTSTGEMVFSGSYNFFLTNERGLWKVEQNNKCGLIHPNGEIVVPFIYKSILTVNPGTDVKLLVVETDSGFGLLDYQGNQILPPVFESISNRFDDSFSFIEAKLRDRYMYFNIDGTVAELSPLSCTTPFTEESYNKNDHKMPKGYIVDGSQFVISTTHNDITDFNGKILCHLDNFHDGLGVAQDDPWIGYMDVSLKWKIREFRPASDALFDFCEPFNNGMAIVWKGNKRGLINTKGEQVAGTEFDEIIQRDWCALLRTSLRSESTVFGDEYIVGNCYLQPYDNSNNFSCMVNGIFDIGNFTKNRTFAQYRNFVGIVTSEGTSIEPIEYEWFRTWNSPKLHKTDIIKPVRRNGVWGQLHIENGFIAYDENIQKKNEQNYLSKHKAKGQSIPYFYQYQKEDFPCGFKWSNLFHIPVEKYEEFVRLKESMDINSLRQWLTTNGVTL